MSFYQQFEQFDTLQSKSILERLSPMISSYSTHHEGYRESISFSKPIQGTVLCHFFNEEYLLPFWLAHHKSIFSHGIMVNYHSTDQSISIIKSMCPTWTIIDTKNKWFDAEACDNEMKEIEATLSGYKIILNVTEFIIAKKPFIRTDTACLRLTAYVVLPSIRNTHPESIDDFLQGIDLLSTHHERGNRFIHSYPNGNYTLGRHGTNHPSVDDENLFILWMGFYPWNEDTIKRKLQIQTKIPQSDKDTGRGFQHLWDESRMEDELRVLFTDTASHISLRTLL